MNNNKLGWLRQSITEQIAIAADESLIDMTNSEDWREELYGAVDDGLDAASFRELKDNNANR